MNKTKPRDGDYWHESEQGSPIRWPMHWAIPFADIVIGTPRDAATTLSLRVRTSPRYLIINIGERGSDVLPEIDMVAEYCEEGTRVVVIGSINDVNFYRELRTRGVIEYFTRPASVTDVRAALYSESTAPAKDGEGKVIAFMSAASGDGASTVALNTAYSLATEYRKSVVLVDMDYQFGMVAKNLDLATPFGIKELFEHPDRGIDSTLMERMIATYSTSRLKVIAAPNLLHLVFPTCARRSSATSSRSCVANYDVVVLDLAAYLDAVGRQPALSQSTHAVMVAQLWLRSVTHSSRLLSAWRSVGVDNNQISLIINRSGAKFKEAVSPRDFERVCAVPIRYYFVNDIKSVVAAENQGKTLLECRKFGAVQAVQGIRRILR